MINDLIIGISQKLDAEFNGIDVYVNEIKQGLDSACFFIKLLKPSETRIVGNRFYREHSLDIHYFPKTKDVTELYKVSDKLMNILEFVEFRENLVMGSKMSSEIVDGVLHFFINYNFTTVKTGDIADYMQELAIKGRMKEYG